MGARGPAPRRDDERRRRNAPEHPIEKFDREKLAAQAFDVDLEPTPPEPDERWHETAKMYWRALLVDPARKWMTSADWATAYLMAESISRDLKPQVVGVNETGAVMATVPIKGANLSSYIKIMAMLGITEAARLRISKEITLFPEPKTADAAAGKNVTPISEARKGAVQ